MTYTLYADRQSGGYFCWFYDYEGEKKCAQVDERSDVVLFAKKFLAGLNYRIVWVK